MSLKKYSSGQKILIVDDIPVEVERLKNILSDYYTIKIIDDAKSALEMIQVDFYPFVIITSNMKSLNSSLFIKDCKNLVPKTTVVVSIDEKSLQSIGNFIRLDIHDFLLKPFNQLQVEQLFTGLSKKYIENMVIYKKSDVLTKFILDTQPNINFILSSNKIVFANNSFYNFFDISSIEEFEKKYKNIESFFIEDEEHGYIGKNIDGENWIKYILLNSQDDFKVKIEKNGTPHVFFVKLNIDKSTKDIVVSFTNIDNFEKRTLEVEDELSLVKKEDENLKNLMNFNMSYMSDLINNMESQIDIPIRTIKEIQKDLLTSFKKDELNLSELYLGLKQTIEMTSAISSTITNVKSFHSFLSQECIDEEFSIKQVLNSVIILIENDLRKNEIDIKTNISVNTILKNCFQKLQQTILVIICHIRDMFIEFEESNRKIDILVSEDTDYINLIIKHLATNSNIENVEDLGNYYALEFTKNIVENDLKSEFIIKRTTMLDTMDNKDIFIAYNIKILNRNVDDEDIL
jgi:CheY-like chemotaxis protein